MRVKKHSIPNFEAASLLLMATLLLGAAGSARAQAAAPSSQTAQASGPIPSNRTTASDLEAAFQRADTNRDGKLSRQEAARFPAVEQRFD
ncbi:MAG: EF-hand domain-containing protein, partial [Polaromonas sp.]|nr:EF-hand domain-containing protein [Polaromonas sp.]